MQTRGHWKPHKIHIMRDNFGQHQQFLKQKISPVCSQSHYYLYISWIIANTTLDCSPYICMGASVQVCVYFSVGFHFVGTLKNFDDYMINGLCNANAMTINRWTYTSFAMSSRRKAHFSLEMCTYLSKLFISNISFVFELMDSIDFYCKFKHTHAFQALLRHWDWKFYAAHSLTHQTHILFIRFFSQFSNYYVLLSWVSSEIFWLWI